MNKDLEKLESTGSSDTTKSEKRTLKGPDGKTLVRMSDFLKSEPDIEEEELKNDFGDLIYSISGMSCIDDDGFYEDYANRAVKKSAPKKKVKPPKEKLVDSDRKGLLVSNIDKKEKMVNKLKAQITSLGKELERANGYVAKKRVEIKLQNAKKFLTEAEVELQDWMNRLDLLVDGNTDQTEAA